jgi:hypothetical protein
MLKLLSLCLERQADTISYVSMLHEMRQDGLRLFSCNINGTNQADPGSVVKSVAKFCFHQ